MADPRRPAEPKPEPRTAEDEDLDRSTKELVREILSISRGLQHGLDQLVHELTRSNDVREAYSQLVITFFSRVGAVFDQQPVKWAIGAIAIMAVGRLLGLDVPTVMAMAGHPLSIPE